MKSCSTVFCTLLAVACFTVVIAVCAGVGDNTKNGPKTADSHYIGPEANALRKACEYYIKSGDKATFVEVLGRLATHNNRAGRKAQRMLDEMNAAPLDPKFGMVRDALIVMGP